MIIQDILDEALNRGVDLKVKNNKLTFTAKPNSLTDELRNNLKKHKQEIIDFLINEERQNVSTDILVPELKSYVRDSSNPLLLSFAQQRLWFLDQYMGANATFNVPLVWRLRGEVDPDALTRSLQEIVIRHEAIRTRFKKQGDIVVQIIDDATSEISVEKISSTIELKAICKFERDYLFDLSEDNLCRIRLLEDESDASFLLLVTMHHTISDDWSFGIFLQELEALYRAFSKGKPSPLEPLSIQYVDYALWQRQWLQGELVERQLSYWREQLTGLPPLLTLPTDRPRPAEQTFCGSEASLDIPLSLSDSFKKFTRKQGATLYMGLLSAFSVVLSRYSGQDDIAIGTPISNRTRKETENLIGFFVNTVVMRFDLTNDIDFLSLLKQTSETALQAYAHQDLPFEQIVEELNPQRSLSYPPLFQVSFTLKNDSAERVSFGDFEMTTGEFTSEDGEGVSRYDMSLNLAETADGITLVMQYNPDLFDKNTIVQMLKHYQRLLELIVELPEENLSHYDILSDDEKHQQLIEWNDTQTEAANYTCIHELFEEKVDLNPLTDALVYEEKNGGLGKLSYRELNLRSNQLAHSLVTKGVGPEIRVGVCLERSPEMIIAIIAILKAGGCYVPLNPEYPKIRLAYMIEDSGIELILTQSRVRRTLSLAEVSERKLRFVDVDKDLQTENTLVTNPIVQVGSSNLAYMIYTSGSTGQPKGTMLTHKGLVNLALAQKRLFGIDIGSRVMQFASLSFDAATWEIVMTLSHSASLYLLTTVETKSAELLSEFSNKHEITIATLPPAILSQLEPDKFSSLSQLIVAGESVKQLDADIWSANRSFYNAYGPTEATVCVSASRYSGRVEIGKPLANVTCYVLDKDYINVPCGVVGELFVGGAGIARGYVERPGLTAQSFVPNQFSKIPGERLYRTGDLVRYLADGNLEFIGRIDHQVKVRGFRIETGEIESVLLSIEKIKSTAVLANEDQSGNRRLVGYVVFEEATYADNASGQNVIDEIRQYLTKQLPDYMVPSVIVELEALPLTVNGKVDREALPAPDLSAQQAGYVAPTSPIEQTLCEIWQSILGIEKVGVSDNFFTIGGDSIVSIQVVSRAKARGLALTVRQLFKHPTIGELARHIQQSNTEIEQSASVGEMRLLPVHHWFFSSDVPVPQHFHQSQLLQVPEDFSVEFLSAFVAALYHRHDALRLRYSCEGQTYQAKFEPLNGKMFEQSVITQNLDGETAESLRAQLLLSGQSIKESFDLNEGPLFKAVYFDALNQKDRCLLLVLHHLAVDGVSWRVLLQDLTLAFEQWLAEETISLAPKTTSYQQWAQVLQDYSQSDSLQQEKVYWVNQLSSEIPALPVDHKPKSSDRDTYGNAGQIVVSLDREETQVLLTRCGQAYRTRIQELLLAGLVLAFHEWTGQEALRINLEGHGREERQFDRVDLSETVGWFTSLYPVCLEIATIINQSDSDEKRLSGIIKLVKEQLRSVPESGLGYGVLRYLTRDEELRQLEEKNSAPVIFNYLGNFDKQTGESDQFSSAANPLENLSGKDTDNDHPRQHLLGFNGGVNNGCLQFALDYNPRCHNKSTIESLGNLFSDSLRKLIGHCIAPGVGSFTPSDFPLAAVDQSSLDNWQVSYPRLQDLYPATGMQMGLVFHSLLDDSNEAYATQLFLDFKGSFQPEIFRQTWAQMLSRHDIFRTAYVGTDREQPLQVVLKTVELEWHEKDWRELTNVEQTAAFESYRQSDKTRGFDFSKAPLMRMSIFRFSDDEYRWMWTHHHSLLDGWSMPIVFKELFSFYESLLKGSTVSLPPQVPYREYVSWVEEQDRTVARAFWRKELAGLESPTQLGIDKLPVEPGNFGQHKILQEISEERSEQLSLLAQQYGVTLNTVFQSAWSYLLYRYSGEVNVVFGQTVSGRPGSVAGIEQMVGLLINTLPVRVEIEREKEIKTWLQELHRVQVERESYSYIPLVEIQGLSEMNSGQSPFNSLLVFENYPVGEMLDETNSGEKARLGFEIANIDSHEGTDYGLALTIVSGKALGIRFDYSAESYSRSTVERLLDHIQAILSGLIDSNVKFVKDLPYLGKAEKQQQLVDWNNTQADYQQNKCIHELFELQAGNNPDAIALVYESSDSEPKHMTYGELNRRSNQLAHYLIVQGVRPEVPVGICVERSLEMIIGILGILKSGGYYVSMDPEYPPERLEYILNQSACKIVLSETHLMTDLTFLSAIKSVPLDLKLSKILFGKHSKENININEVGLDSSNLAYAIYTSGSTGQPKGVAITHQSLNNLATFQSQQYQFDHASRILQFASLSFDAATWDWSMALISGSVLHLIQEETVKSAEQLNRLVKTNQITYSFIPPALLSMLSLPDFNSVKTLTVGGESPSMETLKDWSVDRRLFNAYGPTENTVVATTSLIANLEDFLPIGRPIKNVTCYVLSVDGEHTPVGAVGELFLGGHGLSRGYLKHTGLTAEKFVPNPFTQTPGERLYRTGDLVRYLPDGNLEFIGRVDHQVKVRGFRIELGEIESVLMQHKQVKNVVVVTRDDETETKRLVAYVVQISGEENAFEPTHLINELRMHVQTKLPEYMVPSAIVVLDALPLTVNGKVDQKALPVPDISAQQIGFVAPETETEQVLCEVWQSVLGVEQVGVTDNFFAIGGDSILSIQVVSRAKADGLGLTVRQLFNNPTIRELSKEVQQTAMEITQSNSEGEMIQLPIHQWFWLNNAPRPQHYHQSQLLQVPDDFSVEFLNAFVAALYQRHDALRLRYSGKGPDRHGAGRQARFEPAGDAMYEQSVIVQTLDGQTADLRRAQLLQNGHVIKADFDLNQGPLFKAVFFDALNPEDRCLLLVLHHLVVDGVGWRVLLPDLSLAFEQWRAGESIILGPKTTSYQQWAEHLQDYSLSESLQKEKAFWVNQLSSEVSPLPIDHKVDIGEDDTYGNEEQIVIGLNQEETQALLTRCGQAYRTQIQELLLAGLALAFYQWTGQEALRINLEGHGREEGLFDGVDLSETMGWFTTLYPICLKIMTATSESTSGDERLGGIIKLVKEQLRSIPEHGLGYGVLRYLAKDEAISLLEKTNAATVVFNYLGQFDQPQGEDALFRPVANHFEELSGSDVDNEHPRMHQLSINGMVTNGRLQFMLGYNPQRHEKTTINALGLHFTASLRALINHCESTEGSFTSSDFPLLNLEQESLESLQASYPQLQDLYPATGMQMGLVFHSLLDDDNEAYSTQTYLNFKGNFQPEVFQQAWAQLLLRHGIFRTAFVDNDKEKLLQVVVKETGLNWHQEDWRELTDKAQKAAFETYRQHDKAQGFEFSQAPLMRMSLLRLSDKEYRWMWTHHHSLLDGWSMPIVLNDLFQLYEGLLNGKTVSLPPVVPYRNYVAWLVEQDRNQAEAYWRNTLSGMESATPLGIEQASVDGQVTGQREQRLVVSEERTERLTALAQHYGVTLNTVIQGAWSYLLYRYSGERNIVFGQTVSGRSMNVTDIDQMVGLLINTLPVRVGIDRDSGIGDWFQQLHQGQVERENYGYIPLVEIQRISGLTPGESLFNTLLVFENYPVGDNLKDASTNEETKLGFEISDVGSYEGTGYGLTLIAGTDVELIMILSYAAESYRHEVIESLLEHMDIILDGLLDPEINDVKSLPYLSKKETQLQLNDWNNSQADYPQDLCIHQLIEAWVEHDSDATAIIYEDRDTQPQTLSYVKLNQRANQLANYLIEQGVRPEMPVGLCVERSLDMMVGILAILKTGGCYVPLDPKYPETRLSYLIEDSDVELIVTQSVVQKSLDLQSLIHAASNRTNKEIRSIALDEGSHVNASATDASSTSNPQVSLSASSLAYVIYTSGSTGQPKGVGIQHKGLVSLLTWSAAQLSVEDRQGILASTSMCFDLSVYELFLPLCFGTQCILTDNILSLPHLTQRDQVTLINTVPSAAKALLEEGALAGLRVINLAGEPLKASLVNSLYHVPGVKRVYDLYGPSEGTTYSTYTLRELDGPETIGRPVANTQAYLLGPQGEMTAAGVVGELYLGGEGISRGYLNRTGLTAEKFVPNPFSSTPGERLYRTGDLVRYLADGNLEFIGRVDHQVKVRGFRIELGEIESSLLQQPQVKDVVVMAREDKPGNKRLVAYVVFAEDGSKQDTSQGSKQDPQQDPQQDLLEAISQQLSQRLPDYMVPSSFVVLDALPLTVNGKVDRAALPAPDASTRQGGYTAPRSEIERVLCEVWQSVLDVEPIGITDNFFSIGGDSIVSIQVVSRAKARGLGLTVRQLFKHPTIGELSRHVQAADRAIEQSASVGEMPLLPIHQWFFSGDVPQPQHFHQSQLLQVPEDFSVEFLNAFVAALYQRHDALRLRYRGEGLCSEDEEQACQARFEPFNDEMLRQSVLVQSLDGKTASQRQAQLRQDGQVIKAGFDLNEGPLFKAVYFEAAKPKDSCLLLVLHHLVVDGVSWRVLLQDLTLAYEQWRAGESIQLAPKTTGYQQWSQVLQDYSQSDSLQQEKAYWVNQLSIAVPALPVDHERNASEKDSSERDTYGNAEQIVIGLNQEETQALLTRCGQAYRTQIQELLLAGLVLAFHEWTGQGALRINLEGHGREEGYFDRGDLNGIDLSEVDLSETVGWFTSLYPVCFDIATVTNPSANDEQCLGGIIKLVKEQLRLIPGRGLGYGVLRYLANDEMIRQLEATNKTPIVFNYLGQFDQQLGEDALFSPVANLLANDSGSNIDSDHPRQHVFGFNGGVNNGCLQFALDYNPRRHDKTTIESLGKRFTDSLRALISHCETPGVGSYTPSDFPLAAVEQSSLDSWQVSYPQLQDLYPATGMQQGLVFHSLLDEDNAAYITQMHLVFNGNFKPQVFQQAWTQMLSRHGVFRTAFIGSDREQPLQIVMKEAFLDWQQEDWRELSNKAQEAAFEVYCQKDKAQGFDFGHAPLMRMSLLRLSDTEYRWLWTHHHSLLDGWSLPIVIGDLFHFYEGLLDGTSLSLPSVVPYRDYVSWLVEQDKSQAEAYWRDNLAGMVSATSLGIEQSSVDIYALGQQEKSLVISEESTQRLTALAQSHGVTLNTVIQGAWSYLLYRYSGEKKVAFGQTVSGRSMDLVGIEQMVGLLINTLPVRVEVERKSGIGEWLKQLHQEQVERESYGYIPLVEIQRMSEQSQGDRLFNSLLVFENYPVGEKLKEAGTNDAGLGFEISNVGSEEATDYGLTLTVAPGRELLLKLSYLKSTYSVQAIAQLVEHLDIIMEGLLDTTVKKVSDLPYLSKGEYQKQLVEWNDTRVDYPRDLCIHELFETQAAKIPDAIALISNHQGIGPKFLSYGELNRRSNQLAHYLIKCGVSTEVKVGICSERTIDMLVGILAILKAGGCYVPLDSSNPIERINELVIDSDINILLSQSELREHFLTFEERLILLDDIDSILSKQPGTNIDTKRIGLIPDNLSYLIYTSGSTGQQKGVMALHRSIVNRVNWLKNSANIKQDDVFCQKTNIGFVDHVAEIFQALSYGAPLVILATDVIQTPLLLKQQLNAWRITQITLVPSLLKVLINSKDMQAPGLRRIYSSGEALNLKSMQSFSQCFPDAKLINIYGSSEIGADVSAHELSEQKEIEKESALIGKVIDNIHAFVLSPQGELVANGVVGELLIGGVGLSRGYFNRADLTADRFVPDPFSQTPGNRLYRTGDLVRYLECGDLEFIGRVDHQVKVRGVRIELAEVESILLQHEQIKNVVVVVREDDPDNKVLVAYVVKASYRDDENPGEKTNHILTDSILVRELRAHMRSKLPAYMNPSFIEVLDSLPLTINGKVDRAGLPKPDISTRQTEYEAPVGDVEKSLETIWCEILKCERVSRHDDFFSLGGHSLMAVRLLSNVHTQFHIEIPIKTFFENPSIWHMARLIDYLDEVAAHEDLDAELSKQDDILEI